MTGTLSDAEWLSRSRNGVRFIPIIEDSAIVEGCAAHRLRGEPSGRFETELGGVSRSVESPDRRGSGEPAIAGRFGGLRTSRSAFTGDEDRRFEPRRCAEGARRGAARAGQGGDTALASPPRPKTIGATVAAYRELSPIHRPENVIVVAPFTDKPAGVKELNDAIRASLGFDSPAPQVGDFLMITKNSYPDRDRLNGERYRAVAIDVDRKFIKARLIGTRREIMINIVKPHDKGPCEHVDWGYAATVHKFQGSEAAATIVVIPSGTLQLMKAVGGEKEPWFCDRSFVYTACSRPKLSLVLIGDPKDIWGAIKLNRSDRVTALSRMFAS